MEYCSGGSVADLMAICGVELSELQISHICAFVLFGFQYLHGSRHIHRVIHGVLIGFVGNWRFAGLIPMVFGGSCVAVWVIVALMLLPCCDYARTGRESREHPVDVRWSCQARCVLAPCRHIIAAVRSVEVNLTAAVCCVQLTSACAPS